MTMKNIYHLIWVDAILSFKKHNPRNKNWKATVFLFNTWINAPNLWCLFMALKYLTPLEIPLVALNIFPGNLLDDIVNFTITFGLPVGVLNYFLIFYNNRYELLIQKYGVQKIKYAFINTLVSALVAFVIAILHGILTDTI